jgi:hypothetical protein
MVDERRTGNNLESELRGRYGINGTTVGDLNSKSDNKSDKKVITKNQYEMVCGWLVVYRNAVSLGEGMNAIAEGCEPCRSSVKGKAGEYARSNED